MKFYDAFNNEINIGDEVYCVEQWDSTMSVKKIGKFDVWKDYNGGQRAQVLLDHVAYRPTNNYRWSSCGTCWTKSNQQGIFKRLLKKND